MAKIKDLAVKTGTYTDKSGAEKGRYMNIGGVFESNDGGKFVMISRSFNPAGVPFKDGSDMIIVSMFDVKDDGAYAPARNKAASAKNASAPAFAFDSDNDPFGDIPF